MNHRDTIAEDVAITWTVYARTLSDGGATLRLSDGIVPSHGFAVSTRKDLEVVIPLSDFTPARILDFIRTLHDEGAEFIGAWVTDGPIGTSVFDGRVVYLDHVTVYDDRAEALAAAREAHQVAIYDLAAGEEIPV